MFWLFTQCLEQFLAHSMQPKHRICERDLGRVSTIPPGCRRESASTERQVKRNLPENGHYKAHATDVLIAEESGTWALYLGKARFQSTH